MVKSFDLVAGGGRECGWEGKEDWEEKNGRLGSHSSPVSSSDMYAICPLPPVSFCYLVLML